MLWSSNDHSVFDVPGYSRLSIMIFALPHGEVCLKIDFVEMFNITRFSCLFFLIVALYRSTTFSAYVGFHVCFIHLHTI